ncbi:hypothetical protein GJAV_G00065610 [Gymnothorax javanicus]|nr:hypothetical protein GJAV_G00065610 [Gymnothorax javanicus]
MRLFLKAMSKRRTKSNEESVLPPAADQERELSPPIITRTRSGRRVRTPSVLLDAECKKTPSRRTRQSVIQEESSGNGELGIEGVDRIKPTNPGTNDESSDLGLDPEAKKCKVDPISQSEVNQVHHHTDDRKHEERITTSNTNIKSDDAALLDIGLQAGVNGEKENHVHQETQTGLGSTGNIVPNSGPSKSRVIQKQMMPLGKPKSGRVWKDRNKQRFSNLLRDKPLKSSWEKKMEAKREKELVRKFSLQLKEEKAREKEEKRKRREENLRRRQENERKAEIVQVIRNTAKIKRMKKKQLRKIEKRDTLALLQKSQPKNQNSAGKRSKESQKK